MKNIENMFLTMLKLMYIMFTYDDNYVGKQASSNSEDAVHIYILFWKKVHWVTNDQCCANVCAFVSMLMRVIFINVPKIIFHDICVYIWK